ncbi:MAG: hypothetical protein IT534_03210 [Bauldia sp.]|nr:hypothetical protein [Bauldia sp.]
MTRTAVAAFLAAAALALPGRASAQPVDFAALDAEFCTGVRQYMNWTNATIDAGMANGQPVMLDEVARLDSVGLDCAARMVPFRLYVDVGGGEAVRAERLASWNARWCVPGIWREAIAAGWQVTATISFADGVRYDVTAACD